MADTIEWKLWVMGEYRNELMRAKCYALKHSDQPAGYNAIIDRLEELWLYMEVTNITLSNMPPVPLRM
jgi:hypothetical protein